MFINFEGALVSRYALAIGLAISPMLSCAVLAQESPASSDDEIIVTARKRDETAISVPVVVAAIGPQELGRRGLNDLMQIARLVPQLLISDNSGSVQGGVISLRGVSGGADNPFGDQPVSFNVDGVQVAKSTVRRMAMMDLAQIEVLKGPQALFFGKNSPGGVINIRTADPTSDLEAKLSTGYEFNAREIRGEGFVSIPLNENLGIRIAGYGAKMRGWVRNTVPRDNPLAPDNIWGPRVREYGVRGTLKYAPNDIFSARLKFAHGRVRNSGPGATRQIVNCPTGAYQFGTNDDCRANSTGSRGDMTSVMATLDPGFRDGAPYQFQSQQIGSLELNYALNDNVNLTSVTGYYHTKSRTSENYAVSYSRFAFLPSYGGYSSREISQELRLSTEFDGPINIVLGGYFQDSRYATDAHTYFNLDAPFELNRFSLGQRGKAYSVFGQAMWDILPTLELSVGGRYSYEKKALVNIISTSPASPVVPVPITPVQGKDSWNDFSPEITLSYRPTDRLTVFASYKHGFLSGGFNSGATNFGLPLGYNQQTIKGFEGGVKASLLDGALRTNLALYNYKISGLQVTNYVLAVATIRNAGEVSIKGVEFDASYRTPLPGLTIKGAVSYNRARYVEYFGPCYNGQAQDMGCNVRNPVGIFLLQDLAGTQLSRAPTWSGNAGFLYETALSDSLKGSISSDLNFSSSYLTDATSNPGGRSPKRALLDATITVAQADDRWELSFIGRNLTKKYYWTVSNPVPFTGGPTGLPTGGVPNDTDGDVSRGREFMIRATVRFGS